MSCSPFGPDADRCPTQDDIRPQLLALLPRGRAWGNHDGGPFPGSVLYGFWNAAAAVFAEVNRRICDLREEFWCATQAETRDLWMAEYGLPDACDPFPDLCLKVSALAGTRCEHFVDVAARLGWAVECGDEFDDCGDVAGCGLAGNAMPGGSSSGALIFRVILEDSPAYTGGIETQPFAGAVQAGMALACPPDIGGLICLMDRIVPAHLEVQYVVVNPPIFLSDQNGNLLANEGLIPFVA